MYERCMRYVVYGSSWIVTILPSLHYRAEGTSFWKVIATLIA